MRRTIASLSLLALLGLLAACGAAPTAPPAAPAEAQPRLKVVVTHSILGDIVRNVSGDLIDLTVLVGPGSDPHTYEPSPSDSARLTEAALVFENGLGFEEWLDDLYAAAGAQAARVVVSEGVTLLPAPEEGEHEGEEEHAGEEYDPHIWSDPNNALLIVEAVRAALASADAPNAAAYQRNATSYQAQISELDSFITQQTSSLPAERRRLVTSHDTFGYFASRYGWQIVGTALGSISTEVADPAAGEIAELVVAIKEAGVPAIFAENMANPDLMETIASEAGVSLGPTLYTDALGEAGSAGETYLTMVRYNITMIVSALQG